MLGLKFKLILTYLAVAVVSVCLIGFFSYFFLDRNFKKYVVQKQEDKNLEIIHSIVNSYGKNSRWETGEIQMIGINALENALIIRLEDISGNIIWNAVSYNNGMCSMMMDHMAGNMFKRYPNWKGEYTIKDYIITESGKNIAKLSIGYYGPFYYTDNDLLFINTLSYVILISGIFSLMIALTIGFVMSRMITKPITKVIQASKNIENGDYDILISDDSKTREIHNLAYTINSLADTLKKKDALRKRLTEDVSHELRTPVTTVQGHLEAMIDGIWEPTGERLKSTYEEILRLSRLIGDLEKLSRFESGNLALHVENTDLSLIIKNIIANFEKEFAEKKVAVSFVHKPVMINIDRDKIIQAVINIISNAIKYSVKNGTIVVNIVEQKSTVEIKISDNGNGISKEDLPYIFERFYRADKSRTRETGGSGIGLTITKSIIEAHHGKITVESELNKGTVFTVTLPKHSG